MAVSRRVRVRAGLLVVLATASTARPAASQEPSHAEALFEEARELMAAERYAEACPKLEESESLDPGIGTEFNLARCYELSGRTATAYAAYERVAASTHAAGQSARETASRRRLAALTPRLCFFVLAVPVGDSATGLEIAVDHQLVARSAWGTRQPVDPGHHLVVASAAGRESWQGAFDVREGDSSSTLEIPVLKPTKSPAETVSLPRAEPPRAPAQAGLSTRRILALTLGGAGVVGLGIGTYFALHSMSLHDAADGDCNANVCKPGGVILRNEAMRAGDIATVAAIVGGALIGGGAALWLTDPFATGGRASVHVRPVVASDRAVLLMQGNW